MIREHLFVLGIPNYIVADGCKRYQIAWRTSPACFLDKYLAYTIFLPKNLITNFSNMVNVFIGNLNEATPSISQ